MQEYAQHCSSTQQGEHSKEENGELIRTQISNDIILKRIKLALKTKQLKNISTFTFYGLRTLK
jgi:hypothetical protein